MLKCSAVVRLQNVMFEKISMPDSLNSGDARICYPQSGYLGLHFDISTEAIGTWQGTTVRLQRPWAIQSYPRERGKICTCSPP